MKYLRLFETESDYQSYIENENNHVEPHIALLRGNKTCHYKKYFNALSEINGILENIISRTDKPLDINILNKIQLINQDFTDINNQLEEIILSGYEPLENPENYLAIEALKSGMRVSFSNNCQYSLGTNEWFDLQSGELTPLTKKGQKIYFKATGLVPRGTNGIGSFTISENCNLSGNCNSMLFGDEVEINLSLSGYNNAFCKLFYQCDTIINASQLTLPATTLANYCYSNMFYGCTSLVTAPELPATSLVPYCYQNMFARCTSLTTAPELPATTLDNGCYNYMFQNCTKLNYIKALFTTTPSSTYTSYWVSGVSSTGTFVKNVNAMWDVTGTSGIPSGWTVKTNFTPVRCINLSITAEDVSGKYTTTKIYWTAEIEGVDDEGNNLTIILTGTDTSESFPQNTSTTDTIERTISYTYMGVTATTTITQGIWVNSTYTIDLNNQWQSSSVVNPDSSLYDGVYESFSNKGVNSTAATMYIDINGYDVFDLYIRSYAESSYDYVMVSQLDQTINNNTAYSSTTLVKAHTRGKQKSGTSIDNYTKVSFTGIDGGQHRITIVYRKDGSGNSGDDRGYVLIPKNQ